MYNSLSEAPYFPSVVLRDDDQTCASVSRSVRPSVSQASLPFLANNSKPLLCKFPRYQASHGGRSSMLALSQSVPQGPTLQRLASRTQSLLYSNLRGPLWSYVSDTCLLAAKLYHPGHRQSSAYPFAAKRLHLTHCRALHYTQCQAVHLNLQ